MPYLEEQAIYDQLRPADDWITPVDANRTGKRNLADILAAAKAGKTAELIPLQTPIEVFRCPSDSTPPLTNDQQGDSTTTGTAVANTGNNQSGSDVHSDDPTSTPSTDPANADANVGTANLTACVKESKSPWFFGDYGFELRDVMPLPFRPYKGALGFFDVPSAALSP